MASYEKSWQFDINRAYVPSNSTDMCRYILWYVKAFLTGQIGGATLGLWSIYSSSNATLASAGDNWGSTYTAANIIRASSGAHSWVVLQSPLIKFQTYWFLLDWSTGSDYYVYVKMGVGGAPSGGSTSTAPTLQNSTISNQTGGIAPFALSTGTATNIHLHGALATDGSFNVLTSKDNSGKFVSGFICHYLGNAKPTDSYPVWFHVDADVAASYGYGVITDNGPDNASNGIMRAPNNSMGFQGAAAITYATSNLPGGEDTFDGSYLDMPVFVASSNASSRGVRGRFQDIAFFPSGVGSGTVDSTPGAPTYMIVGNWWFPTNQAPIL